jgi:hypothetical protein
LVLVGHFCLSASVSGSAKILIALAILDPDPY